MRSTDGQVRVLTGVHTADVDVDVEIMLHRTEPLLDTRAWEEIVEISLHSPGGDAPTHPGLRERAPRRGTGTSGSGTGCPASVHG
ncbi:hypothetical protein [Streptomyces clavuligerus]|uniref:hypothetical protein n=1 Tax=Streptomyces clavuligerus TaxID=1901 RepID=UPI00017FF8FA|nr:hypothetical protein [Streptomyces clavuligerus]EDY48704.1 hypothetical protein SSCG_01732 [Streptomyces clavuligerus]